MSKLTGAISRSMSRSRTFENWQIPFPRWSTPKKIEGLTSLFNQFRTDRKTSTTVTPETKMSALWNVEKRRVLIPAYDYDERRATFFRSYRTSNVDGFEDVELVGAIHASSTPPVMYFDRPAEVTTQTEGKGGNDIRLRRLWDG